MKTIAVHSHKGGVGKTTVALFLAKYVAGQRKKVFVLDYDFLGAGMGELLSLTKMPNKYLEDFFIEETRRFAYEDLFAEYTDHHLEPTVITLLLNLPGKFSKKTIKNFASRARHMLGIIGDDDHYGIIEAKTQKLLAFLDKKAKADLVIIDCHPGLTYVSETMIGMADLNVYVTTLNRSDCFGLLKEFNAKRLKERGSFLVLNMAEQNISTTAQLRGAILSDGIVKVYAKGLIGSFDIFAKDDRYFSAIPDRPKIVRNFSHLGGLGTLPRIDVKERLFEFCPKIFSVLEKNKT